MAFVKPYSQISIHECGEPLVAIPPDAFAFVTPHPYAALGAPYGQASPWMLRKSVLAALLEAQKTLQKQRKGWRFLLFDAFRPNAVQRFMVERELTLQAQAAGLNVATLTEEQRTRLLTEKVYRLFAVPSDDPATPPPHSTGAALDCTLCDAEGREVDMGSPLDENSPRSFPDYFATATDAAGRAAHAERCFLYDCMRSAGFMRTPSEWWHFSTGDQLAVWVEHGSGADHAARFGRAPGQ